MSVGPTVMSPGERVVCACRSLGEAFQAETLADQIAGVAAERDAAGDAFTADALRTMARVCRVRALEAWDAIAALGAPDTIGRAAAEAHPRAPGAGRPTPPRDEACPASEPVGVPAMPNEDEAPPAEARREREDRPSLVRKRMDEGGGPVPGGVYDPGTAPPPEERDKTGKPKIVSPKRRPDDAAREARDAAEPWREDASGRPEQPQDRPPARPHMTVTHGPEPSPHEVRENMDGD